MEVGLLGRKVGMTQIFEPESGNVVPVTVLEVGPCHVLQVKTQEKDGYEAIQLGYRDRPRRLAIRSERGHVAKLDSKRQKARAAAGVATIAKAGCEPKRFIREIRGSIQGCEVGQQLGVDVFKDVKAVDISGITKGRGTAGVMKRHGFHGQRATHGVKKVHRHPGSTGCNTDPHHIFKGRRMAGHMGDVKRTIRNLKVVRIEPEHNLLLIRGAVPGANGGYLVIRKTNKVGVKAGGPKPAKGKKK